MSVDRAIRLWKVGTGEEFMRLEGDEIVSLSISPGAKLVATGSDDGVARLWNPSTNKEERQLKIAPTGDVFVKFSLDGKYLLTAGVAEDYPVQLWDVRTGIEFQRYRGHRQGVSSAGFSADGKYIITSSNDETARLWDLSTGVELYRFSVEHQQKVRVYEKGGSSEVVGDTYSNGATFVEFSPDSRRVMVGYEDGSLYILDIGTKSIYRSLSGHSGPIIAGKFSPGGIYAISGSTDGTTRIWELDTGNELCRLIPFQDGNWITVAPDGRFDSTDLEDASRLDWVLPEDPMTVIPLEIFIRDYYEPRLLSRLLERENISPIRSLSELNRVQPIVRIVGVTRQSKTDTATITIEVAGAKSERQRGKDGYLRESGVYDLRLFRDGQIVRQYADGQPQTLSSSATNQEKLMAWRKENEIKLDAGGKRTLQFTDIKLPQSAGKHEVQFTAYAFNEDRVKSETAKNDSPFVYEVVPEKVRKGRAYLISLGVNAYENSAFDLRYSVNDARAIQQTLFDRLSKTGAYEQIVQVPLISDYEVHLASKIMASHEATNEDVAAGQKIVTSKSATKSNLKAVLDVLAGRRKAAELPGTVPNAEALRKQLQQAQPEDLVLISFSSHGYADASGSFFFVLQDTGPDTGEKISEALLQKLSPNFLSSEELSQWLRDVDGGEMLMIVDACHSAAAVAGGEFKPGPMGSRGLGQLSYDKGMRILTATQAADVAYGSGELKQGLLTYVLVKDGIEAGKADFKPVDHKITISEWLEYGEGGVPKLLEEIGKKAKQVDAPVELRDLVQKTSSDIKTQRPSLFDFSKKRAEVLLVKP